MTATTKYDRRTITAASRPFLLTFVSSRHAYLLTSDDAQRLIDGNPIVRASSNLVVFEAHNKVSAQERSMLRPATLGGGPAFTFSEGQ